MPPVREKRSNAGNAGKRKGDLQADPDDWTVVGKRGKSVLPRESPLLLPREVLDIGQRAR